MISFGQTCLTWNWNKWDHVSHRNSTQFMSDIILGRRKSFCCIWVSGSSQEKRRGFQDYGHVQFRQTVKCLRVSWGSLGRASCHLGNGMRIGTLPSRMEEPSFDQGTKGRPKTLQCWVDHQNSPLPPRLASSLSDTPHWPEEHKSLRDFLYLNH